MLYNCEDAACAQPAAAAPCSAHRRFGCSVTKCSARAYGFSPYFQLELTLSDSRTVKSPVTKVIGFDSRYQGVITGQALTLKSIP